MVKLTENRLRILAAARSHRLGLVSNPYIQGFARVLWDNNALYLTECGLLTAYRHGGYEITEAGRTALSNAEGR